MERKSTLCDTTDIQPSAQQVKLSLNPLTLLLIHHKYVHEFGKLSRRFLSGSISAGKNPKCESGSRKFDDATDFHPTAQQAKSGINLLSMHLIYHKYTYRVGKAPSWCSSAVFWAKKIKWESEGRKSTLLWCDRFPTYRSASQIGFESFLIAPSMLEIHR